MKKYSTFPNFGKLARLWTVYQNLARSSTKPASVEEEKDKKIFLMKRPSLRLGGKRALGFIITLKNNDWRIFNLYQLGEVIVSPW